MHNLLWYAELLNTCDSVTSNRSFRSMPQHFLQVPWVFLLKWVKDAVTGNSTSFSGNRTRLDLSTHHGGDLITAFQKYPRIRPNYITQKWLLPKNACGFVPGFFLAVLESCLIFSHNSAVLLAVYAENHSSYRLTSQIATTMQLPSPLFASLQEGKKRPTSDKFRCQTKRKGAEPWFATAGNDARARFLRAPVRLPSWADCSQKLLLLSRRACTRLFAASGNNPLTLAVRFGGLSLMHSLLLNCSPHLTPDGTNVIHVQACSRGRRLLSTLRMVGSCCTILLAAASK